MFNYIKTWYYSKLPVREIEVVLLDPNGIGRHHLERIKQLTPPPGYRKGMTLEEVAYAQGQVDQLRLIERVLFGDK